ncbi:MAG: HAMP domain-containing histidine kinase [Polyangiaceae bacterium]|nr:HAMP domain-containing histidine kinase [Polyangiaceae bacterium]
MSTKGRLTRQELGWLLTQEAQGAAERLRRGVQTLKSNVPPPMVHEPVIISKPVSSVPPVPTLDDTLDALDDAMKILSSLHQKSNVRTRRGRIDLAALIWEVAPDARVAIAPGSGTEIFGDETELRRMVQVLIGHGTGLGSNISIRRDEDEVRMSVALGPDSSTVSDVERAWVSRMAIRYGGRYELEGGTEILVLPADGVSEQKEREALRKELDEARKQGELYAKELAAVLTQEPENERPSTIPPSMFSSNNERFAGLCHFAGGIAAELRSILSPAARQVPTAGSRDSQPDPEVKWEILRRTFNRSQEFVATLATASELDTAELPARIDLAEVVRAAVKAASPRAERKEVELRVQLDAPVFVQGGPRALSVLAQFLIGHALDASQKKGLVSIELTHDAGRAVLAVGDSGTPLPTAARKAFVELELESGANGRPSSVPVFLAKEIAGWQGALFEVGDSPQGGVSAKISFISI